MISKLKRFEWKISESKKFYLLSEIY
jgi:hypothetical protein